MDKVTVSILALFYVWTKSLMCNDAANRDSTFQSKVRRISKFPVSRSDDVSSRLDAHLSTDPFVWTTCLSVRTSDRQASSVWTTCFFRPDTYIISRSFYANLLRPDVSAARPNANQFSNGSLILSKYQEREDQSTVRTMWYPVRTRISVRQESQFKMNRSDIWQLWSGRWCIVYGNWRFDFNRSDVSLSWSKRTRIRYGNCVLKFSHPDSPAPWSGRAKPVMEITCSGRASVQTIEPSRPDDVLIQERFLHKNFGKSYCKVVRPDGHGPPSGRLPGKICLTPILTPSL